MKGNLRRAATISWRTTLGGALSGVGCLLLGIVVLGSWGWVKPQWVQQMGEYGLLMNSIGIVLLGLNARDHGVSSEQARGEQK